MERENLRAFERAVLALRDQGVGVREIARRFRRSPEHINRVIDYAHLPNRGGPPRSSRSGLSPLERRVLYWRERGIDHDELAVRFRRSADHMRRVEGMAYLRKAMSLLS